MSTGNQIYVFDMGNREDRRSGGTDDSPGGVRPERGYQDQVYRLAAGEKLYGRF